VKLLEGNDWILLNDIIYKIHTVEDLAKMQKNVLELIRLLIPYDLASFYLADERELHLLGHPVGIGISDEKLQTYLDQYEDIDYTRWMFISAKSMAYRETDLMPEEQRVETDLYQKMYAPEGLHYSAQLSLAYDGRFMGIITLYRYKGKEDFSERDLFVLDMLKDHLAFRLFKELRAGTAARAAEKPLDLETYAKRFNLTQREAEVFLLLFGDLSNEDISRQLFIETNTLKKHILSIYKKAGVNSRIQLYKLVK